MASKTAILSFLLLFVYCYSLPVEQRNEISKPNLEFTTGKTIIDGENKITMRLVSDDESTDVPNIHKDRAVDENDRDEFTTPIQFVRNEEKLRPLRELTDKLAVDYKRELGNLAVEDKRDVYDTISLDEKRGLEDKLGLDYKLNVDDKRELMKKCDVDGKCDLDVKLAVDDKRELCDVNGKCDLDVKLAVDDKRELEDKLTVDDKRELCDVNGKCNLNVKLTVDDKRELADRLNVEDTVDLKDRDLNEKCDVDGKCDLNVKLAGGDKRELCDVNGKCDLDVKLTVDDKREVPDKLSVDYKLNVDERELEDKLSVGDYLFTTMDTRTKFEERAIRPDDVPSDVESSTSSKRDVLINDMEITTIVPPLSSADSFGKFTGLLNNEKSEEKVQEPRALKAVHHTSKTVSHTSAHRVTRPVGVRL